MKIFRYMASILLCSMHASMGMGALLKKQEDVAQQSMQAASSLKSLKEYKSYQFGDVTITVAKGDITNVRVDAIVNAANPELAWGGGVCGAIFNAAGRQNLVAAVTKVLNGARSIGVGEARVTPIPKTDENGKPTINNDTLQVKYVVHAVGPDCRNEAQNENRKTLLSNAYRNSLLQADTVGVESIAFPAISTAIYAYPITEATGLALESILNTAKQTSIKHILCMVLPNDASGGYDRYTAYLDDESKNK